MSKERKIFYFGLFFIILGLTFNVYLEMVKTKNIKEFNNIYQNIEILPGVKTQKAVSDEWLKSDKVGVIKDVKNSDLIFDRDLFDYFYNYHLTVAGFVQNYDRNINYRIISYDNLAYILLDEENKPMLIFSKFEGAEGVYDKLNAYLERKNDYIIDSASDLMLMHSVFDEKVEREKYDKFVEGFSTIFNEDENTLIYTDFYFFDSNEVSIWSTKYASERTGVILKHFYKYYLIYIGLIIIFISILKREKRLRKE